MVLCTQFEDMHQAVAQCIHCMIFLFECLLLSISLTGTRRLSHLVVHELFDGVPTRGVNEQLRAKNRFAVIVVVTCWFCSQESLHNLNALTPVYFCLIKSVTRTVLHVYGHYCLLISRIAVGASYL